MPVQVQIAGVSSLEEALAAERAGADALGFTLRLPTGIHDDLTEAKARSIIAALPPFITSVLITYLGAAREAVELCRYLGVGALQLHGEFPVSELAMIRAALPHLKIIRSVHVTGPQALVHARPSRHVDAYSRHLRRRHGTAWRDRENPRLEHQSRDCRRGPRAHHSRRRSDARECV
jgi:phosphoribosylanthranilate isomerase